MYTEIVYMKRTTVISVRLPEEIAKELKEAGIEPSRAIKKALREVYRDILLQRLKKQSAKLKGITDREVVEAIKEGRA